MTNITVFCKQINMTFVEEFAVLTKAFSKQKSYNAKAKR